MLYERVYGMADREYAIPDTIQSKFKVALVTKQFTTAYILQRADAEKFKDDEETNIYNGSLGSKSIIYSTGYSAN